MIMGKTKHNRSKNILKHFKYLYAQKLYFDCAKTAVFPLFLEA